MCLVCMPTTPGSKDIAQSAPAARFFGMAHTFMLTPARRNNSQWINILDTQFIFQPPNDHGTAHCYHIDWKAVLVLLFCAGSKSITLSTMTCISNAASFSSAEPLFFVPQGLFFAWRSPDPPRRVDVTSLWLVNCS